MPSFFAAAPPAFSRIIHIPDDLQTIQAGINASQDGDTVVVDDGLYEENLDFAGKAILHASRIIFDDERDHITNTIIDGRNQDCAVAFNSAEGRGSILQGFTCRNGIQNFGGGIDCQRDTRPILRDLLITGNTARQWGGGIYFAARAAPLVERCIIENNTAEQGGGVASNAGGAAEFRDVIFRGNSANYYGGAIYGWAAPISSIVF